jgi:hypothetical protein
VRPSNPTTVAKVAPAPVAQPARGRRAGKNAGRDASGEELPDSVLMEAIRAVSGEELSAEEGGPLSGPCFGVLYRLTVRDGAGRPFSSGKCMIRKHLRPAGPRPEERAAMTAQIVAVPLDAAGAAHDFVGLSGVSEAAAGSVADVFEYFSFELRGMTYVVPRSGYLLRIRARGGLLQVTRASFEGDAIHGAVGKGLMTERAGDTYACKMG